MNNNKIFERWNLLANADLGTDVQPMAIQFEKFFERVSQSRQFEIRDLPLIIPSLRGCEFYEPDLITVTTTHDLCHVTIHDELNALTKIDSFLMDHGWLVRYQYALDHPPKKQQKSFDMGMGM